MTAPKIIRSEIAQLSAYHVQPAAGGIKLDAMENPFSFPEALRAGLAEALSKAALNRYPSAAADELKDAIRGAMNIAPDLDILLGNGSDEIIQIIAMACAKPSAALLSVETAFRMFYMIPNFCRVAHISGTLEAQFSIDDDA